MPKERILVIAHGHPKINKGGGEIAAYNLFLGLKKQPQVEKVVFIGRAASTEHESTPWGQWTDDELLFNSKMTDYFLFSQENKAFVWKEFRSFLEVFKPTIVHFHHYFHLGLEMIREVKNYSKSTKLILTLHEYLGICFNSGQMIKTGSNKLCYKSSPRECNMCFPEIEASQFLLRDHYIKAYFHIVDQFISPSKFLIKRYTDWGLDPNKIEHIENGQPKSEFIPPRKESEKVVIAFFGQINPYKGVDVFLEAVQLLPKEITNQIQIQINGANLEYQPQEFKEKILKLLKLNSKIVINQGGYEPEELPGLLSQVNWVVIPSIWWENAPMVIQEAFNANVPILCSNIGGMAEQVEDRKTGIHFRVGKPADLANKIVEIVENRELEATLKANIRPAQTIEECAIKHMDLYNKIELA